MSTIYWIVLAIPSGALILYACWKVADYVSSRQRRRSAAGLAESGYIDICLWGFNDSGDLTHARTRQKAGPQREVRVDDIPEFLRSNRIHPD